MIEVEVIVVPHIGTRFYDLISAGEDGGMVIERFVTQDQLDRDLRPRVTIDSFGDFLQLFNTYRKLALMPRQTEEVYEIVVRKKGSR